MGCCPWSPVILQSHSLLRAVGMWSKAVAVGNAAALRRVENAVVVDHNALAKDDMRRV